MAMSSPQPNTCRQDDINSIVHPSKQRISPLLGPWFGDGELAKGAFVSRFSVFLPQGDWEMPKSEGCLGSGTAGQLHGPLL